MDRVIRCVGVLVLGRAFGRLSSPFRAATRAWRQARSSQRLCILDDLIERRHPLDPEEGIVLEVIGFPRRRRVRQRSRCVHCTINHINVGLTLVMWVGCRHPWLRTITPPQEVDEVTLYALHLIRKTIESRLDFQQTTRLSARLHT